MHKKIEIKKEELVQKCREIGVKQTAIDLGVSQQLIYTSLRGIDLGGHKRCGRKKKLVIT